MPNNPHLYCDSIGRDQSSKTEWNWAHKMNTAVLHHLNTLSFVMQKPKQQHHDQYLHSWCLLLVRLCVSVSSHGPHFCPRQLGHEHQFSSQTLAGHQSAAQALYAWRTGTNPQPEPCAPRAGWDVLLFLLCPGHQRWWGTVPLQGKEQLAGGLFGGFNATRLQDRTHKSYWR